MQTTQLSSKVPLELFQPSSLDFTPCLHSITMNRQGTLARSKYPQHLGCLASQDMGPVLTMLALQDCPLHLKLNLDGRLSSMATLLPQFYTHVATSLVARISVVHQ